MTTGRAGLMAASRRRAEREAKTGDGFRFDRVTALGVGMLIGLSTVVADGLLRRSAKPKPEVLAHGHGWKAVARRTLEEFNDDRIPAVAAGSTFFALLALFPALGVFVSLYGLIGDVQGAERQIASLAGVLPAGGVSVLSDQIERLAATPHASLGLTFLVSLLLSVWSANAGMKGLIAGLNVAYELREKRNFLVLNLQSLGFTGGAILFALVMMGAIVAVPEVLAFFGLQMLQGASVLRWPLLLVVSAVVLSLLYRYAPSPHGARWRWITPGGIFATVAWMAMSLAFSAYVGRFGHYDKTYGSLGAIVGFMTWIWLSLIVVLAGAELNSEIERETQADTPAGHGANPAPPPGPTAGRPGPRRSAGR
ncbi:MAG TPA: YihY/virulence factor BrkB family protein [Phenylobacterium sp.]|jgi:membrane protein